MPTLEEVMTKWRIEQAHKHGLGEDFVQDIINKMSNYEFMVALSEALEEMRDRGYLKN